MKYPDNLIHSLNCRCGDKLNFEINPDNLQVAMESLTSRESGALKAIYKSRDARPIYASEMKVSEERLCYLELKLLRKLRRQYKYNSI
jgi:hypothetical protein